MSNNITPHIASGLPEFIRGNSPLLVEFIDTYYKYVEQREKAVGMIQNIGENTDVDETLDEYLNHFYDIFADKLPTVVAMDKRNFIKILNDIYDAKGTQKAIKLLFRAVFNEDVSIYYPSEQILIASDGTWIEEKYITLITKFGNNPISGDTIVFSNAHGDFVINTTNIVQIAPDTCRVFFRTYSQVSVDDSQLVYVYTPESELKYVGQVVKSPARLRVTIPGEAWQIGQVISITGDGNNTTARVTGVDENEGISKLEILEYGNHEDGQICVVSPYPFKPASSNLEIDKTLVSISPNVYHHTINITDSTDGVYESVFGVSDAIDVNSYFLTDYVDRGYFGTKVIEQSINNTVQQSSNQVNGLTIQEWLASRATLVYEYDNLVSTKGYFYDEKGQLSNQTIRLQDNYFYQAFSYVIETTKDIKEYRDALDMIHPAGTKRFSILEKSVSYHLDVYTSRTLSLDTTYFLDLVNMNDDTVMFDVSKIFVDTVTVTDSKAFTLNKNTISDSVSAISADTTNQTTSGYDTGTYFLENYASHDYQLTIG